MKPRFAALPILSALALAACQGPDQPDTTAPAHHQGSEHNDHGIAWHKGDVAAAFALAAQQNKPLFLYWGAIWCPPCVQIKSTIFNQREFIDRTRLFVPVYLDGDTEQAQQWGEKFGVLGYPTVIVFSPAGEEITRIPGGINIEQYASVLDTALASMTPVPRLLQRVSDGGERTLGEAECRLLAYYSWDQDNQRAMGERNRAGALKSMWQACPQAMAVERSRLYGAYLVAALEEAKDAGLPQDMADSAYQQVMAILTEPALLGANLSLVIFDAGNVLAGLSGPGSESRATLEQRWRQALDRLENDYSLSKTEHVLLTLTKIQITRADDPQAPLPEELLAEARAKAAWADANSSPHERQTVMYYAYVVLAQAGLVEDARALVTAEIEKSETPYYFMSVLAGIERKAGNTELAIGWLKRAYDESRGPATRFQWGTNYVLGLVEMTPADAEGIEQAAFQVLGELDQVNGAFYNRNSKRLATLDESLRQWSAEGAHRESIQRIRQRLSGLCAGMPTDDPSRATCESFLAEA